MPMLVTEAVPRFTEYEKGRGLAEGTVRRHGWAAAEFARSCQATKGPRVTMGQIDPECVSRFFAAQEGGQGSRNNKLETVRAFLTWADKFRLLRPGFTAAGLLEGYRARKAERQPKHYIPAADFAAALDIAGNRNPCDRAVVALALYTLGRQSELKALRLRDLDLEAGTVRLFRQKRQRNTETGVTPELDLEMRDWLAVYAREMGYMSGMAMTVEHPDWLLVPSRQGWNCGYRLQPEQPICAMERVAKRVLTGLGVQGTREGKSVRHLGEGMHTLRRSGARAMLKHLSENLGHQRALVQVSIMLDHEDTKMTLQYIGMEQEKDELNDWLRGHSMYGRLPEPIEAAVLKFRRPA
jgi:integrase